MKKDIRRFAPASLYLSLVAALLSVGLYIVQREFNLYLQISLSLFVIGLASFTVMDPERVRIALTGRQARYGSNTLIITLAFTGIIVVINYVVFENPKRWDLTENKQFTLAPETLDTIKSLPSSVKMLAFFTTRLNSDNVRALLDQYKYLSDGKIEYEFIDPEAEPILAQKYNITQDGSLIILMGEHQQLVNLVDEKEITGALIGLISPEERTIYFLTGHGELDPEGTDDYAYTMAKASLENKNYKVSKLNLLAENKIPEDATVIVIAGPLQPVSESEVDLLKNYVATGGSMVVMEEPLPLTDFGDQTDALGEYLSSVWGVTLGKDMIVDLNSNQPFITVANQYTDHIITNKLRGVVTIFPTARSVTTDTSVTDARITEIVLTSPRSWAETDLTALTTSDEQGNALPIQPDEGVDLIGPITLAVTIEDQSSRSRLVIFGDAEFASDVFYSQYSNGDLFVNSVDWAAEQETLINLTPKENIQRLLVPPGRYTLNLILFGAVIFLPGLVLASGIVVWVQRRRRG